MNYGTREVIELLVFDEKGKKVAHLDSLKNSYLKTSDSPFLLVKDGLFNGELMEFIHKVSENNLSDFEKELSNKKQFKEVIFNPSRKEKCKLIAKTIYRVDTTLEDKGVYFEIPVAYTNGVNEFTSQSIGNPSTFDCVFNIGSYNDQGDILKILIEQ